MAGPIWEIPAWGSRCWSTGSLRTAVAIRWRPGQRAGPARTDGDRVASRVVSAVERVREVGLLGARVGFATALLEPFTDEEVRAALTFAFTDGYEVPGDDGPVEVTMQHAAREALIERCLGDPFLFQLAGAAAWDADTGPVITAADVEAGWQRVRREVDAHVRNRIAGLTPWQLQVLTAVAPQVGRTRSSEIGSTLQGLVAKRLLAHDPDGYRVISRSLAHHLAAGPAGDA